MTCFASVPTSVPADCSCRRMLQTLEAVEGACAWRQKQVHTQQTLTPYFCLQNQHFAELTFHQRDEHKCIFTTGEYSPRRQLHLSNHMLLVSVSAGKQAARSSRLCHASVMLLYRHVWNGFCSYMNTFHHHIGIKSHITQWHTHREYKEGGPRIFPSITWGGKARRKEDSQKNQVFLWLKLRIWFLRKKIHKRLKNSIQK